MTQYLLIGLAAAILALAGAGYALKQSYAKNGKQAAQIEQLQAQADTLQKQAKANAALLKRRAEAEKVARAEAKAARKKLEDSLSKNPEWANSPVPREVQDALAPKP